MKSITVMLTTIGRPNLIDMLKSLTYELQKQDYLYIFVDGLEYAELTKKIYDTIKDDLICNVKIIVEETNLGYWGHGLRNKHQNNLLGDYIINADDDDIFIEGSFEKIRQIINSDNEEETIYYFQFFNDFKTNKVVWSEPFIAYGNIGTPSGVIPNKPDLFGIWGYRHGGDFDFYSSCNFKKSNFVKEIIYVVRPYDNGFLS